MLARGVTALSGLVFGEEGGLGGGGQGSKWVVPYSWPLGTELADYLVLQ